MIYCYNMWNTAWTVSILLQPKTIWTEWRYLLIYHCNIFWLASWNLRMYRVCEIFSKITWWHHQMETKNSALLALCAGNSQVTGEFQRGWALMFSLICIWTNGCANNRDAGDLKRHRNVWMHLRHIRQRIWSMANIYWPVVMWQLYWSSADIRKVFISML